LTTHPDPELLRDTPSERTLLAHIADEVTVLSGRMTGLEDRVVGEFHDVRQEMRDGFAEVRSRKIPSDPVRAIVDSQIDAREKDAIVARVAWWQNKVLGWTAKGIGAVLAWLAVRAFEAYCRGRW
jgi:hypothetical protein